MTAHLPCPNSLCYAPACFKSDNILLGEYQGQLVAKLADFGAVRIAPELLNSTHYSALDVIGTRPYQPPEYTGFGHVSEKTDTYAFGVVALELLTGKPPSNNATGEFLHCEMGALPLRTVRGSKAFPLPATHPCCSHCHPVFSRTLALQTQCCSRQRNCWSRCWTRARGLRRRARSRSAC